MTLPLSYNWRNLFVRKFTTGLTMLVVAVVVLVLVVLLSFGEGIRASVGGSGRPDNLLVLNSGATSESTSLIWPDEARLLVQTPGIALDPAGAPLASAELSVQTDVRRANGAKANVAVRGVDDVAFAVHPEVQVIAGRRFEQGTREAIVGQAAHQRYQDLRIGDRLRLGRAGNHEYTIVGVFTAGGSAFESEIWAPRTMISDSYVRAFNSAVILRLADPAATKAAISYVNGPSVRMKATLETDYYRELSEKTYQIVQLSLGLVLLMSIGAVFAVANTMYAAVDGRKREIAMLRTIGFSRAAIIFAFVIESTMICSIACVLGILAALPFSGVKEDYLSDLTWTVTGFEIRITPFVCLAALVVSVLVGIVGAVGPAVRAARVQIITALRKA